MKSLGTFGLLAALVAACSGSSGTDVNQVALTGDFVAGGILADSTWELPRGDGVVVRFDAGKATWSGVGKAFPDMGYTAAGNGNVSMGDEVAGILSRDGEIMVLGARAGIGSPEFWGAIKAIPGLRLGNLAGDYLGFAFGARDGGPCYVRKIALTSEGFGLLTWHEVMMSNEMTREYGFRDGLLSVMGSPVDDTDDHTTGAMSSDGNVVILTDLDPPDLGVMIVLRKSTTGIASAWNGTYECVQFGLDSLGAADCWTARVTLTVNGTGAYTYRAVDVDGILEQGAGTYTQKADGTLTTSNGLSGIVSPDGDTVLLGVDEGGRMALLFGVRR